VRSLARVELSARKATVQLAETFTISRGSDDYADVVQVEVRHGEHSGFGEAAPLGHYEQSAESAVAWLEQVDVGDDPFALDEIFERLPPGEDAARAALDHALHDLQGKLIGRPVYKLLGLRRAGPPTSWTI
jgi:L-Ala-D/L-Glu epimerase